MATNAMIERAARAVATQRITSELGFPAENPMVATAIEARWRSYEGDARAAIASLADLDDGALSVVKPAKERPEFVGQWDAVITGIIA